MENGFYFDTTGTVYQLKNNLIRQVDQLTWSNVTDESLNNLEATAFLEEALLYLLEGRDKMTLQRLTAYIFIDNRNDFQWQMIQTVMNQLVRDNKVVYDKTNMLYKIIEQ